MCEITQCTINQCVMYKLVHKATIALARLRNIIL